MILEERNMDLFVAPKDYSLVYTIAKDFVNRKGYAAKMNNRYKAMNITVKRAYKKAKDPGLRCIGFKPLNEKRFIYNLIIKDKCAYISNYEDLFEALIQLKDDMAAMDVTKIAMPKIGIGDDGLNWDQVKEVIELAFGDTNVEILVCCTAFDKDNPPTDINAVVETDETEN